MDAEDFGCGTWTHPGSMDLKNPQIDVHIDGHDVTLVSDVFVPVVQLLADIPPSPFKTMDDT